MMTPPPTAPLHFSGLTQAERLAFTQRQILYPVLLFLGVTALYLLLELVTVAAPWPVGIVLGLVSGMGIVMLFVIGHDACHGSYTASPILNHVIGRLALAPGLHGFSLWDLGHNKMHHGFNNLRGSDAVWAPWSPQDYRAASPAARAIYRFHRSAWGAPFYYMTALWWRYLTFTSPDIRRTMRPLYLFDTMFWMVLLALQTWAAIAIGGHFGHTAIESAAVGIVIPILTWFGLMSLTVYVHHTHPSIRWFATEAAWRANKGVLSGTAHVIAGQPFDTVILSIMAHHAHHAVPGVPLYNLTRMQRLMESRNDLLVWHFSWRRFLRIAKRCQLYDYDRDRWMTFQEAAQPN